MLFKTEFNQIYDDHIVLQHTNWNDWWEYETLYIVSFYDSENEEYIEIGSIKIGQFKMQENQKTPEISDSFEEIGDQFFSLGTDVSYYEYLNELGEETRDIILDSLNDIVFKENVFEAALEERVTRVSLLRDVSTLSIKGQYKRLVFGDAELSSYNFKFISPPPSRRFNPMELEFKVIPRSNPPTNIHVIIGRNGVGKTHLQNAMISSLMQPDSTPSKYGFFSDGEKKRIFSNLVSVTFSAFDESELFKERKVKGKELNYSYIGLKQRITAKVKSDTKSPTVLKNEFVRSVKACRLGAKHIRWKKALKTLESDPIFNEAEISKIDEIEDINEYLEFASSTFKKLSSGHKVVLLSITKLVETIEEKSLVLIDEPESHLHPPLLSAFIRALSNLLIQRNGVAIIATHSPVVLQEVPLSCAWKLRRNGGNAVAERLETESFGENVGILTREIFGLEVTDSGFHKLLKDEVDKQNTYEEVLEKFSNEVGAEAKALIRSMFHQKTNNA